MIVFADSLYEYSVRVLGRFGIITSYVVRDEIVIFDWTFGSYNVVESFANPSIDPQFIHWKCIQVLSKFAKMLGEA